MKNKKIHIFVITHKNYEFPKEDLYTPFFVGAKHHQAEFFSDNTGINISDKNPSFCELTGLYWIWKNKKFSQDEYIGLVHYRRYFKGTLPLKNKLIASESELENTLSQYDAIIPKRRNYFVETIYSHYKNAHHIDDLDKTRQIISENYPDYTSSFDFIMQGRKLHLYNMFILKYELFEQYCSWLFNILFELEKRIDIKNYNTYQKRVFGFIAERLFNVWIFHNKINCTAVPVVNIEGENIIKKAFNLLKRKVIP